MSVEQKSEKTPLLQISDLKKHFPFRPAIGRKKRFVQSVQGISFTLYDGEVFGLVGESGCGKSTTGRTILRLTEPTSGEALYKGKDIFKKNSTELRYLRKEMQMVFQDPYSSLNPKKRVGPTIEEPMVIHNIGKDAKERKIKAIELLQRVGFTEEHYYRFPHEFSGGQRQRIGLARALAVNPKLIICDEPVSALDVSIQSQVINLLEDIKDEFNLTYLFIAHDLSVVRHISDRIGVMYLGNIVEQATTEELFDDPKHPYTRALLSAIPIPDPKKKREKIELKGEIPSPLDPPTGCVFHTRCPMAMDICKVETPKNTQLTTGHSVSCHLYG